MKINFIHASNISNNIGNHYNKQEKLTQNKIQYQTIENPLNIYHRDYMLSFKARIDKKLPSFYERNEKRMPASVKEEMEAAIINNENISPLAVHQKAYEILSIPDITTQDVKEIFADDKLFDDLKTSEEAKGVKQGLIYDINSSREDFKKANLSIFKNPEKDGNELSIYLLRKFFLEGKTYKEVNADLHEDLDSYFQRDNKTYIYPSTLKALGIKLPNSEYMLSLFFTREGMEDIQGEKIKQGREESKTRFSELSEEEQKKILAEKEARRQAHPISEEKKAARNARLAALGHARWESKTPEEQAAWMLKMLIARENSDSKYQSYAMILTWNNSLDIRQQMSDFFQANSGKKVNIDNIIENQNTVKENAKMLEAFWKANPQTGKLLSKRIANAWTEIKSHIQDNTIDDFCKDILNKQFKIKMEAQKASQLEEKQQKEIEIQKIKEQIVTNIINCHCGVDVFGLSEKYAKDVVEHPITDENVLKLLLRNNENDLAKEDRKPTRKKLNKIFQDTSNKYFRELMLAEAVLLAKMSCIPNIYDDDTMKNLNFTMLCELLAKQNPDEKELLELKTKFNALNKNISDEDTNAILKKLKIERGRKAKPLSFKEKQVIAQQIQKLGVICKYIFDENCSNIHEHAFKRGLFLYKFLKNNLPNWPKDAIVFDYKIV